MIALKLFITIPGVGEITATMIIGELGDITRFKTNKQLNAYVGIDINQEQHITRTKLINEEIKMRDDYCILL